LLTPFFGESAYTFFQTVGLLLSPFVFLIIYLGLLSFANVITKSKTSLLELCLQFAFTLVPIAFVYNIAHYYTLLLTEGQNMFRIISDPFGFGWNLFNTSGYEVNLSIIDANFTWHFQVALILVGHIVGTYLAHLVALKVFPSTPKHPLIGRIYLPQIRNLNFDLLNNFPRQYRYLLLRKAQLMKIELGKHLLVPR